MSQGEAQSLDPRLREELAGNGPQPPLSQLTPERLRESDRRETAERLRRGGRGDAVAGVTEHRVHLAEDTRAIRVYQPPRESSPSSAPPPVLVYLHGGGWVVGDLDTCGPQARLLCRRAGVVVASVDYRLAPEHPFPAAVDDADAAAAWVRAGSDELGVDPQRVAVGGDSAGATLAAGVALRHRDRGEALAAQVLTYPVTDPLAAWPSMRDLGERYNPTREAMRDFVAAYLPDPASHHNPVAVPMRAEVSGTAPAIVVTAGFDPLRDEGDAYARRLAEGGVTCRHLRFPALLHGFASMVTVVPAAEEALAVVAGELAKLLGKPAVT